MSTMADVLSLPEYHQNISGLYFKCSQRNARLRGPNVRMCMTYFTRTLRTPLSPPLG